MNPDGTPRVADMDDPDDDDTMDPLDNGDMPTKTKEEVSEFMKQGGIISVDQAILMSIANCGKYNYIHISKQNNFILPPARFFKMAGGIGKAGVAVSANVFALCLGRDSFIT